VKSKSMILLLAMAWTGCSGNGDKSDAYGNFETTEIMVSAEASGKLISFAVEEGTIVEAGMAVGCIDTIQLSLKRMQLMASRQSVNSRSANVLAQIGVLEEQKRVALTDQNRLANLIKDNAATQKQLDDINGQIRVIGKQIQSIETQNSQIFSDLKSLDAQIAQISDQIQKSILVNPIKGTVLTKYAEPNEVVAYGKPLYKIADITTMFLRVYVSGDQLPNIKIGQKVRVLIDKNKKENKPLEGEVNWISAKAEFTPKIIQTKEERVNMVYAVKVKVLNDGTLKIGMPGEANFIQ
jgi:HlyD family secretion protein